MACLRVVVGVLKGSQLDQALSPLDVLPVSELLHLGKKVNPHPQTLHCGTASLQS
jgi:hypothetical protein